MIPEILTFIVMLGFVGFILYLVQRDDKK